MGVQYNSYLLLVGSVFTNNMMKNTGQSSLFNFLILVWLINMLPTEAFIFGEIPRCEVKSDCPPDNINALIRYSCNRPYCVQDQLQWVRLVGGSQIQMFIGIGEWVRTSEGQWVNTGIPTNPWVQVAGGQQIRI